MKASSVRRADRSQLDLVAVAAVTALPVASKFEVSPVQPGMVRRARLSRQLDESPATRLAVLAAPTGFGKTTVLSQWAARTPRAVAWLTLEADDDDSGRFWRSVLTAFGASIDPSPLSTDLLLRRLLVELASGGDVALVLDDAHHLTNPDALDELQWLIEHLPPNAVVLLASRAQPRLRLAALRAQRELVELGMRELRFTLDEGETLLARKLARFNRAQARELTERAEGWPAALYLAALSAGESSDASAFVRSFTGANRHIRELIAAEALPARDAELSRFLIETSVLGRLTASLCDAVRGADDSASALEALERANMFLVPLDDRQESYRYQRLFGEALAHELDRTDPGAAATIHRRAFAWHRRSGTIEEALHHALAAGEHREAVALIEGEYMRHSQSGRRSSLLPFIEQLPPELVQGNARLLCGEAWLLQRAGRWEEAEHVLGAAADLEGARSSSASSAIAIAHAAHSWRDATAQLAYARRAVQLEPRGAPWRSLASFCLAYNLRHAADPAEAARFASEAAALAGLDSHRWAFVAAAAPALEARAALRAGDSAGAEALALLAFSLTHELGIEDRYESFLVPWSLGVLYLETGRPEAALPLLDDAAGRARQWDFPPHIVDALVDLSRVTLALGDFERSRALLRQARATLERFLDPGVLAERVAEAERSVGLKGTASAYGEGLSAREADVLRLLPGDLSRREIATELYLSPNTVQTHMKSIYRKLGVSSRAEAVRSARSVGYL